MRGRKLSERWLRCMRYTCSTSLGPLVRELVLGFQAVFWRFERPSAEYGDELPFLRPPTPPPDPEWREFPTLFDFYPEQPPTEAHTQAPIQATPTEAPQIETHTRREELGNMESSQLPLVTTPANSSRGRPYGRAGTCSGGESHVDNSRASKPPHCAERGSGGPRGSGRGDACLAWCT